MNLLKASPTKSKGSSVKRTVGLWIDHRETVMVFILSQGEVIKKIQSKAEKHASRVSGARSTKAYEAQLVPADDRRQNALTEHLNDYYDEIISCIKDAESILIFGPGEAKYELKKRIDKSKSGNRISAIETVDKMTGRQIAAKVRKFFKS